MPSHRKWWSPRSIARSFILRPKVYISLAAGIAAGFLMVGTVPITVVSVIAWTIGGIVYLTMATWSMTHCEGEAILQRAEQQDESAIVILAIVVLAIAASFVAILGLLGEAKTATGQTKVAYIILAALTLVISWAVSQVAFAIHYAHEYYAPTNPRRDQSAGLAFSGTDRPDYLDFLYFATSIGATSQTADVSIKTQGLRRLATAHAVVSFFFNTMVLALMVNLAASLA